MKQNSKFPPCLLLFFNYVIDLHLIVLFFSSLNRQFSKITIVLSLVIATLGLSKAQLPANVLVGYHENWNSLSLIQTGAGTNYNVINLAFGLPKTTGSTGACMCDIVYALPPAYASIAAMVTDINTLHAAGKKVLLSLGGATGPIFLGNAADQTTFINSVNTIFTAYGNKIDGIDLDLEGASMNNSNSATWTMTSPLPEQTYLINAIQSIMATYQTVTGKKMLLTMAPEVYYCTGALASGQIGSHGGIFLPVIDGLRTQLDLLHMQLYNAPGGMVAWNGITYNEGTGDFALALNETMVKGFTLLNGKGTFTGLPASKIGFGLPANTAAAGTGFLAYADICTAAKYFKGIITTPPWTYTMTSYHPSLRGLMTWDINLDLSSSSPTWAFASNYICAFPIPAPVTLLNFDAKRVDMNIFLNWRTTNEINNDYYSIERSSNGVSFSEIAKVKGLGTSTAGKLYEYTDNNNAIEATYYRLAQYDFDGVVHYSSIVIVEPIVDTNGLHISINPFDNVLIVTPYGNGDRGETVITVIDYSGKLLTTKNVRINEECRIGEDYKSGFYILQSEYNGTTKRYKVVKQ